MSENQDKSNLARQIDENLRRAYADVEVEEIPDRFTTLLQRLKEQEKSNDE